MTERQSDIEKLKAECAAATATVRHLLDAGDSMIIEIDTLVALQVRARDILNGYICLHDRASQGVLMPELVELRQLLTESIEAREKRRAEANAK